MTTDAYAFLHVTAARCADEVREWSFGHVYRTRSLPLVHWLNGVEVATGAPDAEAIRREMPPGVDRPSVIVEGEGRYLPLDAAFDDWERETEVVMTLTRAPDAPPDGAVREATGAEVDALLECWLAEEYLAEQGPAAVAQLLDASRRQREARADTRAFVSPDGLATTSLWTEGGVAQVEDVYTAPEARNRGHARALVSFATRLAVNEGHHTVFLVADQDDTPKELYERLGFAPGERARRYTARVSR